MKGETTTGGFLDHDDQIQLVDTALKHGFLGAEHAPEGIHRGGQRWLLRSRIQTSERVTGSIAKS